MNNLKYCSTTSTTVTFSQIADAPSTDRRKFGIIKDIYSLWVVNTSVSSSVYISDINAKCFTGCSTNFTLQSCITFSIRDIGRVG
jgi:hypothetical protein